MILAIGDSNLYPSCTETDQHTPDPTNMGPLFAEQMGQDFKCWSKNGASNYWIETHIEYFLADTSKIKDPFLFVGWTSTEREEWPWLYNNISVCGGPDFGIPEPMKARYEQWKTTLTREYMQQCTNFWHSRIHQMHLRLQDLGIRHLFWTTYDNFKSVTDQVEWHGNFYKPYDANGCMAKFFEVNHIDANEGDPFHYGPAAQQAWATELGSYARANKL